MNKYDLHTSRLLIKCITPIQIHELFETLSKEDIKSFFGCDDDTYLFFKEMHEKGMETHRISLRVFLLISKDTQQTIGECGFHTWNASHRRAELYYAMRNEKYMNLGYMKEALVEVLKYGFTEMNLHRIQALIDDANTPSKKLLHHFGFVFEGTLREDYSVDGKNEDSECYSLLKTEWANKISY